MIAFVMSGGGNRGALEAGALLELLEAGIKPEMLVGTSAGALNAAFLATNPTLEGARKLADLWTHGRKEDFFPSGWFGMIWRLIRGQSLFSSDGLRRMAERYIPPDKRHFRDLQGIRLYTTAANLNTGKLYVWGDQSDASIIDAAVASAAHPLAFPPLKYQDYQLVDGGVVANVPIGLAVEKGATEIYVLNVGYSGQLVPDKNNVLEILNRSIGLMMYQPFLLDLKFAAQHGGITLHHIAMLEFQGSQMWDLEHGGEMVEAGRRAARDYLTHPAGLGGISFVAPGAGEAEPPPPPGAESFVPPWLR